MIMYGTTVVMNKTADQMQCGEDLAKWAADAQYLNNTLIAGDVSQLQSLTGISSSLIQEMVASLDNDTMATGPAVSYSRNTYFGSMDGYGNAESHQDTVSDYYTPETPYWVPPRHGVSNGYWASDGHDSGEVPPSAPNGSVVPILYQYYSFRSYYTKFLKNL